MDAVSDLSPGKGREGRRRERGREGGKGTSGTSVGLRRVRKILPALRLRPRSHPMKAAFFLRSMSSIE